MYFITVLTYNTLLRDFCNLCISLQSKDNSNTADFVTKMNSLKSHDQFNKILFSSHVKKVFIIIIIIINILGISDEIICLDNNKKKT